MRILALLALTSAACPQAIILRTDPSRISIVPSLRSQTIANGPAFFSRVSPRTMQ